MMFQLKLTFFSFLSIVTFHYEQIEKGIIYGEQSFVSRPARQTYTSISTVEKFFFLSKKTRLKNFSDGKKMVVLLSTSTDINVHCYTKIKNINSLNSFFLYWIDLLTDLEFLLLVSDFFIISKSKLIRYGDDSWP